MSRIGIFNKTGQCRNTGRIPSETNIITLTLKDLFEDWIKPITILDQIIISTIMSVFTEVLNGFFMNLYLMHFLTPLYYLG